MCGRVRTLSCPSTLLLVSVIHLCAVERIDFNQLCFRLFVFHDIIYYCKCTPQGMGGKWDEEKQKRDTKPSYLHCMQVTIIICNLILLQCFYFTSSIAEEV